MTEISDFAGIVLIITAGFALAVVATKLTERVPVPAPAIFSEMLRPCSSG